MTAKKNRITSELLEEIKVDQQQVYVREWWKEMVLGAKGLNGY